VVQAIKGMNDVLPESQELFLDTAVWTTMAQAAMDVFGSYGYKHVWLPLVEDTALFARGLGEASDIVSKEMYTFSDRGERSLTLRPEGTAGAVRAYIEHGYPRESAVQRWWYMGPMFRAERPQKGRYRQFYQVGAEFFGASGAAAEAETLFLVRDYLSRLNIGDVAFHVNTLGDAASRQRYRETLLVFLKEHQDGLCESCKHRMERNPLRVLDCKRPACKQVVASAPDMLDALTPEAMSHFDTFRRCMDAGGMQVVRDARLVRGLDYYTGVIFECVTTGLGAQDAVAGGGRYDGLVTEFGGASTPAVGFAAGMERLALLIASQGQRCWDGPHFLMAPMDEAAAVEAMRLACGLRKLGYRVEVDVSGGRVKQQMRRADKTGAAMALVLGSEEIASRTVRVKYLQRKQEVSVPLDEASLAALAAAL
jgi:histidyl-tRNA synthetase